MRSICPRLGNRCVGGQISPKHRHTPVEAIGSLPCADELRVIREEVVVPLQVLPHRLSGTGEGGGVDKITQPFHQPWNPTRTVELLHIIGRRRIHLYQVGRSVVHLIKKIHDTSAPSRLIGHRAEMKHCVCAAADGLHYPHRIAQGPFIQDFSRGNSRLHQLTDPDARLIGAALPVSPDARDKGTARKAHSQSLTDTGHGVGRAQKGTGPTARTAYILQGPQP